MTNNNKFFKRNELIVNRFIRNFLVQKKTPIVHGGRAQNNQLPRFLERKPTKDWDVFVKKPRARAKELESLLDKRYRGDFFRVKRGATQKLKVNKVVSNIDDQSVADFSIPDRIVPTITKRGLRMATLKDQLERAKQNVKNPELAFRKQKDLNLIKRVKKFEKLRGRKI